jgi:hypothetical protein
MTAYEASDLLNGVISNQLAGQALFITIISAYVVVAYSVGEKLTKYQVSFINIAFLLFAIAGMRGGVALVELVYEYSALKAELTHGGHSMDTGGAFALWMVVGVRVVLVLGSLIFMWQVRHPKTE